MGHNDDFGTGDGATRLHNDTTINVAQLLKEPVGASRKIAVQLDWFALDADIMARDVWSAVRLTRINDGILATGEARGTAIVECVRCLEMYDQPFEGEFDQEYRPTIDIRSGLAIDQPAPEDEIGPIDELHQLNLAEPIRQVGILAIPIKPVCRDGCPGLPEQSDFEQGEHDDRFDALEQLLRDEIASDDG
jgi:uncharacterized protein